MLIKQKDDVHLAIELLEGFLALTSLSTVQREGVEEELKRFRMGAKGEKEAAYHIDFALKNGQNWVVIHDLRLEHKGRVAQIDHVLISRMFDLIVIESKNVQTGLRVNPNGEWEVQTRYGWNGMASPVEQNKRHIQVLSELISDHKLTPTRLGFHILPKFHNWVLVPPQCGLPKERGNGATIMKMDLFDRGMDEHNQRLRDVFILAKVCAPETIREFGHKLVTFHQPASFDYAAKFGITDAQRYASTAPPRDERATVRVMDKITCEKCQALVETKVASFCRSNPKRFGGQILCRACQTAVPGIVQVPECGRYVLESKCQECRAAVDTKVVAFCRFNSRRFNRRVLCRRCQTAIPATLG